LKDISIVYLIASKAPTSFIFTTSLVELFSQRNTHIHTNCIVKIFKKGGAWLKISKQVSKKITDI